MYEYKVKRNDLIMYVKEPLFRYLYRISESVFQRSNSRLSFVKIALIIDFFWNNFRGENAYVNIDSNIFKSFSSQYKLTIDTLKKHGLIQTYNNGKNRFTKETFSTGYKSNMGMIGISLSDEYQTIFISCSKLLSNSIKKFECEKLNSISTLEYDYSFSSDSISKLDFSFIDIISNLLSTPLHHYSLDQKLSNDLSDNNLWLQNFIKMYNFIENPFRKEAKSAHIANDGRIYHWFHMLNHTQREQCKFNGKELTEAFDVKCAFYTFIAKLLESHNIPKKELYTFQQLVSTSDIYLEVKKFSKLDLPREDFKEALQQWRNTTPSRLHSCIARNTLVQVVDNFFITRFPTIRDILLNYRTKSTTYTTKNGITKTRKTKCLQEDCTQIETEVISQCMCTRLLDMGIVSFSVHDALYVTKEDKAKYAAEILKMFYDCLDYECNRQEIDINKKKTVSSMISPKLTLNSFDALDIDMDFEKDLTFKPQQKKDEIIVYKKKTESTNNNGLF